MMNNLDVKLIEDKSVEKKLKLTAKKLHKKYENKRTINERVLNKKSLGFRIFKCVMSAIGSVLFIVSAVFCVSISNSSSQKAPQLFAGLSNVTVDSNQLQEKGVKNGENIIVRTADAKSLKVGDSISYYVYGNSYYKFNSLSTKTVDNGSEKIQYSLNLASFFGFQTNSQNEASLSGSKIATSNIIEVYEDSNGNRWFKTSGFTNQNVATHYVCEDMIIGVYEKSNQNLFCAYVLKIFSNMWIDIVILVVSACLIALNLFISYKKNIQKLKLAQDVIEEKRKLTDDICIKNNIGYSFSKKDKYKVLAQASDDEKLVYLSLLWRDGSAPNALKKYYHRKYLLIEPLKRKLEVNRNCEKMLSAGKKDKEVAKYYQAEMKKIDNEYQTKRKKLKFGKA